MLDRKSLLLKAAAGLLLMAGAQSVPAAVGPDEVSCGVKPTVRGISQTAEKNVEILADDISFPKRGVVHLKGYTQLIRGGHRVYADELIYDKNSDTVVASGVVKFETPQGDVIHTSVLNYDIESGRIVTGAAEFLLADRKSRLLGDGHSTVNAHGTAQKIVIENEKILELTDARVTSCLDGEKDATFTASTLTIDTDKGVRTAERAKVRISAPERHKKLDRAIESID